MISGVGVPDIRGAQNKGTFYTQAPNVQARESEQVVNLPSGMQFKTHVIGPRNTKQSPAGDVTCEILVHASPPSQSLVIETGGSSSRVEVGVGKWSDWVRFKFKLSMLQSVTGIARVYVRQMEPWVEFYVSAVNFDPAAPLFPVSSPSAYAKDVAGQIGLFSTLGMAEDHNGLNNSRFDEKAYLDQCELVIQERERLMRYELGRFNEGFFFLLYDTPDRVQHMLWRFREPEHPGYEPDLAREYSTLIEQQYARCDKLLELVFDHVDEDTLFIVLSDHGFNSFRRGFDTNTWLWQNGLLQLKDGKKPREGLEGAAVIDWSRTYAYAVGLGGIYLNFNGREREGVVLEGTEADRVRNAIVSGLSGIADPSTQREAIKGVSRREEIYSGPYAVNAPDLLVNFRPGFRVSWQSAVGGFANSLIEDNNRKWSGDHIIDPEAVPGILLMNRNPPPPAAKNSIRAGQAEGSGAARSGTPVPPKSEMPSIIDLAPTILNHLGVPVPEIMEGNSLI